MGYFKRPEATAEMLDQEGWLHTGMIQKIIIFVKSLHFQLKNLLFNQKIRFYFEKFDFFQLKPYFSGDIGYVNEQGWLYVIDRLKELIKVKGLQVPPAELEDLLLSNPDIVDCAVIGIPDERSGEVPKAYVVKKNEKLTEKEIMDFVKSRL